MFHLDLSVEQKSKNRSELTTVPSQRKSQDNKMSAVSRVRSSNEVETRKIHEIDGYLVETDSAVRLLTGPVVGEVTTNTAVILLEVTGPSSYVKLVCRLYEGDDRDDPVDTMEKEVRIKKPFTFKFGNLKPETTYTAVVNGICKYNVLHRTARFTTKSENITSFRAMIVSCDRPGRLLLGQQNPWLHMLKNLKNVNCILHVGDQIYPDNEDIAHAGDLFGKLYDGLDDIKQRNMMIRGRELWRNKYRNVFSREGKVDVLSRVSNLMIWSDNDVANDFTTLKNEQGEQAYHPNFLQCGMMAFREYQRRLWDPECRLALSSETKEWHAHHYGPIGIFMFDLRGNRIDGNGVQFSERSLLSDEQWSDLEQFFQNPDLRVAILCSETPFIGDEPGVAKQKVADEGMDMLRDHWPFNEDELIRLCDLCFGWKAEGQSNGVGREVLLIGGDIHCGVTSVIRDADTGMKIDHLTTSPVTNHVCKFFPPNSGNINERYSYTHKPLGREYRNYATVDVKVEPKTVTVRAKLVPITTDVFREGEFDEEYDSDY